MLPDPDVGEVVEMVPLPDANVVVVVVTLKLPEILVGVGDTLNVAVTPPTEIGEPVYVHEWAETAINGKRTAEAIALQTPTVEKFTNRFCPESAFRRKLRDAFMSILHLLTEQTEHSSRRMSI